MSWRIGQAVSGSEAPSRARRERDMLGGIGVLMLEGGRCVRLRDWRMGLERERVERMVVV